MGFLDRQENRDLLFPQKQESKNLREIEEPEFPEVFNPRDNNAPRQVAPAIPTRQFVVVSSLPNHEVRQQKLPDGTILDFITIEEALSKILNS